LLRGKQVVGVIHRKDKPDFQTEISAFGKKLDTASFKGFKEKPVEKKYTLPLTAIGTTSPIDLTRKGMGRMYYTARLRIAYEKVRTDPVNAGMQVERSYHVKDSKGKWIKKVGEIKLKRGDLVRIDLLVKAPATRYQVALVDSLPAGLEPLNTELAGTSKSDASMASEEMGEGERGGEGEYVEDDWWYSYWDGGFYHQEMRLTGLQTFARNLNPKQYNISYMAQAVATGEFSAGPALVEEMYSPDVYGKSTPTKFIIGD
jgi:alpha-2-macroglobulin